MEHEPRLPEIDDDADGGAPDPMLAATEPRQPAPGGASEVAGGAGEVAGGASEVAGGASEVAGGAGEVAGGAGAGRTTVASPDDGLGVAPGGRASIPAGDGRSPLAWTGPVVAVGLALAVVEALVCFGAIVQGLAVRDPAVGSSALVRIGFANLSNIGATNALVLVLAALLAGLPGFVGAPVVAAVERRRGATLGLTAGLAVFVALGAALAVIARVHVLHVAGRPVDTVARRVLATYLVGTVGVALAALVLAVTARRIARDVTPHP